MIKNRSDFDFEIAELGYDTSHFRLLIREQICPLFGDPLNLDLHNFIRDSPGYHRIGRIDELHQSIRRLTYLRRFAEREADDENANREALTGQELPMIGDARKVTMRAAAGAKAEASAGATTATTQVYRQVRCQILKATLRAGSLGPVGTA